MFSIIENDEIRKSVSPENGSKGRKQPSKSNNIGMQSNAHPRQEVLFILRCGISRDDLKEKSMPAVVYRVPHGQVVSLKRLEIDKNVTG